MTGVSDLSSAIQAGTGVAIALGSTIGFVWRRFEKKSNEMAKKSDEMAEEIGRARADLDKCEGRAVVAQRHRATMTTVIELMWQELSRLAPSGPVLRRAGRLLDSVRHDDTEFPEDEAL